MSRIGSLGSDQIRALNRLRDIGRALSQNTERLSTLRRINAAKDDPSGLVQASVLESELAAAEAASRSLTRAGSMLSLADATIGEVVGQLQQARSLAFAAAGGTLTASEVAANQAQLDSILGNIDSLSKTEFAGRRLLNGESAITASGVNNAEIADVDVLDKTLTGDVTVSIEITTQATQASNSYTSGSLGSDTTLVVEGPDGTTTIALASGADTQAIADAFNAVAHITGINATRIDGNQVDFATTDYGSSATINIEATEGTFALTTSGEVSGTDAVATINGQSVTGDGSSFNVNTTEVALVVEVDPTANGTLTSFTVTGTGLQFVTGSSPTDTARIGLPNLNTASLGGVTGKLSSLRSGGANALTGANANEAVRIIDDALSDALRSQARVGGFQKFTIETSSRVNSKTIENLSESLSAVRDTDIAVETALLTNNELLQQSAFEALSIINLRNSRVLNLLRAASGGV